MRYYIDVETGVYGIARELRIIEVSNTSAFSDFIENASEQEVCNLGLAFGKPV